MSFFLFCFSYLSIVCFRPGSMVTPSVRPGRASLPPAQAENDVVDTGDDGTLSPRGAAPRPPPAHPIPSLRFRTRVAPTSWFPPVQIPDPPTGGFVRPASQRGDVTLSYYTYRRTVLDFSHSPILDDRT